MDSDQLPASAIGPREDRDFVLSFTRLDGDSLFRLAQRKNVPLGALDALVHKQMLKALAPDVLQRMECMPPFVAQGLKDLAERFEEYAADPAVRQPPGQGRKGAASIGETALYSQLGAGAHLLLPPVTAGHPACVAPILFPYRDQLWFSPTTFHLFSREAMRIGLGPAKVPLEKQASLAFELFIARVLPDAGYKTDVDGTELVGMSLARQDPAEADVLAWNNDEVVIVEVKAEAEPHGAWSETNVAARRRKLMEDYAIPHARKVARWQEALGGTRPRARTANGVVVDIPTELAGLPVRGVIISARVEPRLDRPAVPVVTYMSRPAAAAARKHIPDALVCPWWTGDGSPVEPTPPG